MADPQIRYCRTTDGVSIGYTSMGDGPPVVWQSLFINQIAAQVGSNSPARLLARARQVILFDGRGVGQSQRDLEDFSLEARVRDLEAVVTALKLKRFDLLGEMWSCPVAVAYAARHPRRVKHLVLRTAYSRASEIVPRERFQPLIELALANWRLAYQVFYSINVRDREHSEETERIDDLLARGVNEGDAARWLTQQYEVDVTDLLTMVRCPTLVMHARRDRSVAFRLGQEVAARIKSARFLALELPTDDYLSQLESFLDDDPVEADASSQPRPRLSITRTVLFTDLVGHTEMMRRLGDDKGRDVLREHERITRELLREYAGSEVKTMGDGFMASFGSVTKAMDCAIALQRAFEQHSASMPEPLHVRVGLNAGEPIEEDGDLFGSTVIMASRIAAKAGAGEILIPEPLRHLLTGKSYVYADRGETVLKGFEDAVRLYEVRWRE
jgi:class 3 adenylate cyclase